MPPELATGPAPTILRHFWLLFVAVMVVNVVIWRRRLRELEAAGRTTREEADRFLRGALIVFVGFGLLNEVLMIAVGPDNFFCVPAVSTSPLFLVVLAQGALTSGLLLWWVWRGGGADTLARLGPALASRGRIRERPYSPRVVRALITLWAVGGWVGWLVMQLTTAGTSFPRC